MLILQLFIFALGFFGFGIFSFIRRKKFVGWLFVLLGVMLFIIATVVVIYYPQTLPVKF